MGEKSLTAESLSGETKFQILWSTTLKTDWQDGQKIFYLYAQNNCGRR